MIYRFYKAYACLLFSVVGLGSYARAIAQQPVAPRPPQMPGIALGPVPSSRDSGAARALYFTDQNVVTVSIDTIRVWRHDNELVDVSATFHSHGDKVLVPGFVNLHIFALLDQSRTVDFGRIVFQSEKGEEGFDAEPMSEPVASGEMSVFRITYQIPCSTYVTLGRSTRLTLQFDGLECDMTDVQIHALADLCIAAEP